MARRVTRLAVVLISAVVGVACAACAGNGSTNGTGPTIAAVATPGPSLAATVASASASTGASASSSAATSAVPTTPATVGPTTTPIVDSTTPATVGPTTPPNIEPTSVGPTSVGPTTVESMSTSLSLPAPDGAFPVGVADIPSLAAVGFYPAAAGTGGGHRAYIDPSVAQIFGLPAAPIDQLRTTAVLDAAPAPTDVPRPVVVLTPGWRSVVAVSTSLAEELASHGYVVIEQQSDIATEITHSYSTDGDREQRYADATRMLDRLGRADVAAVVGPLDLKAVALGGHSYAGSIAFAMALRDRRVAAAFDLDGSLYHAAATTPTKVPSLIVVALDGLPVDPVLATMMTHAPHTVAVGLLNAAHFDLTDAPWITAALGTSVASTLLGPIGKVGTTDTSTIVLRFLDAALGPDHRLASSAELITGLPGTTADPFAPEVGG